MLFRSLAEGALAPWKRSLPREFESFARGIGIDLHAPWQSLTPRARDEILYGDGDTWPGALSLLDRKNRAQTRARGRDDTDDDDPEEIDLRGTTEAACDACHGTRLRPEALAVRLAGQTIADLSNLSLRDLRSFCESLELSPRLRSVVEIGRAHV